VVCLLVNLQEAVSRVNNFVDGREDQIEPRWVYSSGSENSPDG
jgi:hypothetical protein